MFFQTTLINLFPSMEIQRATVQYQTLPMQSIETSTTLAQVIINSTAQFQTTAMLNSTLEYPTMFPVHSFSYNTWEYQHETHVYPTTVNITHITSTEIMNYTVVEEVDNHLPIV